MNGEITPRLTARQKRIVKAAVEKRLPPAILAEHFRTTRGAMNTALYELRRKGIKIDPFSEARGQPTSTLRMPSRTLAKLRREAKRRGLSPRQLTERILREVLKRGLVADLLDGGGT